MPITIKRTVLIGIGGTGQRVLQYVKGEFQKHFPKGVPPAIKLIAFDTDTQRSTTGAIGPIAALHVPSEFKHLTATGVRRLLQLREIQAWAPPLDKWDLSDIVSGTGQRRASGRLALFNNALAVYNTLKNTIAQVKGVDVKDIMELWPEFQIAEPTHTPVEVYVVASLAGGTGSGMLLDIGFMVRDIIGEEGPDRIIGIFLLPGIFTSFPASDFARGNAYAALKELDFWLDTLTETEVEYPGGIRIKWGGPLRKPYNFVYLLDNVNEAGAVVNKLETMLYFIARGIFLHMTIQSHELSAFWSNLNSILQQGGANLWPAESRSPKVPRYMSFGISTLQIPLERHIEQNVDKILVDRLKELIGKQTDVQESAVKTAVFEFLRTRQLTPEHIINRLRPPAVNWKDILPKPPERPHLETAKIITWKDEANLAIAEYLRRAVSESSPQFSSVREEVCGEIRAEVNNILLNGSGHLAQATVALQAIKEQFSEYESMLSEKIQKLQSQIESITFIPVESVLKGWFIKHKIEKLVADYTHNLNILAEMHLEKEILLLARSIVQAAIAEINQLIAKYNDLNAHLNQVLLRATLDLEDLGRRQASWIDPFATIIREQEAKVAYSEREPIITLDAILKECTIEQFSPEGRRLGNPLEWIDIPPDDVFFVLKRVVRRAYEHLLEQNLDMIIQSLWQHYEKTDKQALAALRTRLQEFLDKARPLWRVNVEPGRQIQYLMIVGINARKDVEVPFIQTLIENGELSTESTVQESFRAHHFALGWEKFAVRALRIGLPAPAYALSGMTTYRAEYVKREADSNSRVTHHIHKAWVGAQELPDLFPEANERG